VEHLLPKQMARARKKRPGFSLEWGGQYECCVCADGIKDFCCRPLDVFSALAESFASPPYKPM